MPKATCIVPVCDRPGGTRGLCPAHYHRWQRYGDPGNEPVKLIGRTGCQVDACARKHFGNGYCQVHAYRLREHGDPLLVKPPGSVGGETHPSWRGSDITYSRAHQRVAEARGKASNYDCVECGATAGGWAYVHGSPDPLWDAEDGRTFSADVSHYQPMCVPCHHAYDHPPVTHCVNGHEYDQANTYIRPEGTRDCRPCRLERTRQWRMRKRMATAR